MNIHELATYNLSDAVKFHNRLNPRLWDEAEQLRPEVREKLLQIAADFQEFLGVNDLEVEDITISGSNAAYSYTPHSDIDLHLVVRQPQQDDEVYQELFNAKKYQYNDMHNIRVRGADVELYVQPADQKHVSLGVYSVLRDEWVDVPKRKRAKIDHDVVQHKYDDLRARIESALEDGDYQRIDALTTKIKEYRQAGLDAHGEFGPENLAFKMLRTQGLIKQLYDAKAAAKDQELSLKERERQQATQPVTYGFKEDVTMTPDGVSPTTQMFLNEQNSAESIVAEFIEHVAKRLQIDSIPQIELHADPEWSEQAHSFGRYEPESHTLHVSLPDRHILDILRTTAHELAHCKQNELETLPDDAGDTGSDWENEAHAVAGILMRDFADAHPDYFNNNPISEGASGYIPTKKQAQDPRFSTALTVDIKPGEVGRQANKMGLQTDRQGKPALIMKSANLRESTLEESLRAELAALAENFADGKNPGRKGLAKRMGVNTKASVSDLRKTAKNSSGEKQRMAHWLANMKAGRAKNEDINEIARLPKSDAGDFGDKGTLADPKTPVEKKPLPGGSGFTYAVNKPDAETMEIMIFDGDTLAAELDLFYTQDVTKAWRVETVVTDPDYRGRGLGKALYGIALSILKLTIEAGDTQTRNGQQMWLMLNSIPGVEVQGYNQQRTSEYQPQRGDNIVDQNNEWTRYTFPVTSGSSSMRSGRRGTGIYTTQASMIAKWTGQ